MKLTLGIQLILGTYGKVGGGPSPGVNARVLESGAPSFRVIESGGSNFRILE